jgi:ADP-heptose:LPS heptosyltransferase
MWRKGTKITPLRMNAVLERGGLGDNICRLPALKYIFEHHPHVSFDLWVPDYFVELAEHALKPWAKRATIRSFKDIQEGLDEEQYAISTSEKWHTTLHTHLVHHAFHALADRHPDDHDCTYLRLRLDEIDISHIEKLPERYAVIPTGFTAPAREMIPSAVNGLSEWLNEQGVTPVYLGKKESPLGNTNSITPEFKDDIDYTLGIDLRDKTNLLECGKILSGALAVIGLDNGLLHLAGMTDVPIVAGYTTLHPDHRMPYRRGQLGWRVSAVVPDARLDCRFCQSNTHFIMKHDYRKCFYDDYICTKSMTADTWIEATKKIWSDE